MPAALDTAQHLPPPALGMPTLSINHRGRVYLSHELARRLGLKPLQPIDLYPPRPGDKYWYLDLRPKAKRRINWYADTRPRIPHIVLPAGIVVAGQRLVLQLVPGEPEFPHYYPLQPDALPS
ncbi:hypothetical protein [Hymenobacter cheonanensis]|uniref:hypothetical protein n=1 Tax=Hymenobacter sp. CA2-7 TaxID=3063993 RepID=UPI002712B5FB|nr:hypothetical protein [Hymenobacter sp. CA2-7]MDO7888273.1 hypothetical protein [Hymenobacter sp. CA2-7]